MEGRSGTLMSISVSVGEFLWFSVDCDNSNVSDGGCQGQPSKTRTHGGVHRDVSSVVGGGVPTLIYTDYVTAVLVHSSQCTGHTSVGYDKSRFLRRKWLPY